MASYLPLNSPLNLPEKALFFHQLAAFLKTGLTVEQSLSLAANSFPRFKRLLQTAIAAPHSSLDLATALSQCSPYFDQWTIRLIEIAQSSGTLVAMCENLAHAAERQQRWRRLYRSLWLTTLTTVVSFLILGIAVLSQSPTWLIIAGVVILVAAIGIISNWRHFQQRLPLIPQLTTADAMLNLAELALPLRGGMPILTALELFGKQQPKVGIDLNQVVRQIRRGKTLSESLQHQVPPLALGLIRTGEETGDLSAAFQGIAIHYEMELEQTLRQLKGILLPVSFLAAGGVVVWMGIQAIAFLLKSLPN